MSTTYPSSPDTFEDHADQGVEIAAESQIIPGAAPYTVTLDYIPLGPITNADGSITPTTLVIVGFTEVTEGTPQAGQYICNYDTGVLTFNLMDGSSSFQASYTTAGDTILAAHVNNLQDGLSAVQTDLVGSPRGLKAVINTGGSSIDIFGGTYGRGGAYRTFAAVVDQSHVAWAVAGTYYVYLDSSDALVLNGGSFPSTSIPICTVVTATGGVISTLTDSRVLVGDTVAPASAGVSVVPYSIFIPGTVSVTGGPIGFGIYHQITMIDIFGFDLFNDGGTAELTRIQTYAQIKPVGSQMDITVERVGGSNLVAVTGAGTPSGSANGSVVFNNWSQIMRVNVTAVGSGTAGGDVNVTMAFNITPA